MKKLIVFSFAIAALGLGGSVLINTEQTSANPSPEAVRAENVSSMIDDIAVPLDVILYAQTNYQGSAITKANKISRNGKPHYSLRVDNDTEPSDFTSFHLIYDEKWQLVGEQKQAPPQETKKVEPRRSEPTKEKEQEQRKPEPTPAQTQNATPPPAATAPPTTNTSNPNEPKPDNSGSGSKGGPGGGDDSTQSTTTPTTTTSSSE